MFPKSEHYVYASSLGSSTAYPNNTVGKYTNRLNPSLKLDGRWEIGCVQLIVPTDICTITKADKLFEISIAIHSYGREPDKAFHYKPTVDLYPNDYREAIIYLEINFRSYLISEKAISPETECMFWYSEKDKCVQFDPTFKQCFEHNIPKDSENIDLFVALSFATHVAMLLGLPSKRMYDANDLGKKNYLYKYMPVLYSNVQQLYVYSDLIETSHVGDMQSEILDVMPLKGSFHKTNCPVIYKPLKNSLIESVSIVILDQNGNTIPFKDGGSTTCILHIRKVDF